MRVYSAASHVRPERSCVGFMWHWHLANNGSSTPRSIHGDDDATDGENIFRTTIAMVTEYKDAPCPNLLGFFRTY